MMQIARIASPLGCSGISLSERSEMDRPAPSLMRAFMPQRSIRFSEQTDVKIQEAVRSRGFRSPTKFIRYAVDQELTGRGDSLTGTEERLAATIEQMRRELFRLGRGQQALFAYVDSLAKVLLTCIPEPPHDAKDQAIARAKDRHNRLMKSAGAAMVGDSRSAMQDLVNRDEK
jgi:Arc/MetJ-type ribon-helix-helix transcriptional regulator